MAVPTNDQRAAYKEAAERIARLESWIKPQVDKIEADCGLPAARSEVAKITDEFGEPFAICDPCGAHIWDGDDYAADQEGEAYACRDCKARWNDPA